jgi:hypothetical protein
MLPLIPPTRAITTHQPLLECPLVARETLISNDMLTGIPESSLIRVAATCDDFMTVDHVFTPIRSSRDCEENDIVRFLKTGSGSAILVLYPVQYQNEMHMSDFFNESEAQARERRATTEAQRSLYIATISFAGTMHELYHETDRWFVYVFPLFSNFLTTNNQEEGEVRCWSRGGRRRFEVIKDKKIVRCSCAVELALLPSSSAFSQVLKLVNRFRRAHENALHDVMLPCLVSLILEYCMCY